MIDLLSAISTKPQEQFLLDINFENATVGDKAIVDNATGRTFYANGVNPGEVVDDPTMGKCFKFTGTGGFSFDTNQTVPIRGKKVKILADYKPDDTTQRALFYTGLNHIVHVPGHCLLTCIPGYGELFWVDDNLSPLRAGLLPVNTNRKQIEMRTGLAYGTKIMTQGSSPSGIGDLAPSNPQNGPTFYLASIDPRHSNVYPGFKGLLKSIRMIEVP